MDIYDQVCSPDHAKQLKKLGLKQQSLFWYHEQDLKLRLKVTGYSGKILGSNPHAIPIQSIESGCNPKTYSAFTVAELGVMLPSKFSISKGTKEFTCRYWWGNFYDGILRTVKENSWHQVGNKIESYALAEMLIYLLENKLITTQEVNSRITKGN